LKDVTMNTVRVFDPAMCCSSGVCGPSVDPQLARFAADLDWLKAQGVSVERFNLAQQPAAFAEDALVRSALETKGEAGLPVVKVNGEIKSSGVYPSRAELAGWAGIAGPAPSLFTEAVAELVAIGAAIASSCEPCFKFHYDRARKLGVSHEDMLRAVTTAQNVKEASATSVLELAGRYLRRDRSEAATTPIMLKTASSSCCAPAASQPGDDRTVTKSGGCC
jgi:AhpD family alkylhydroperoxidase